MRENILYDLAEWGCDIELALARFDDDRQMYMDCLIYVSKDKALELLGQAIEEKNIQAAFEYSHTLKGVYGNLGLIPMQNANTDILEPLRIGKTEGIGESYARLLKMNEILKNILFEKREQ